MKKRFETCTVTLTPLSPIHISGGNPNYGWGAVWLNTQSKLYILDSELFSKKLAEADLLEKYIEAVERWIQLSDTEKSKQSNPCFDFINDNRKSLYPNTDIEIFVNSLSINAIAAEPSECFIRNGNGKAYIPGSSIKGAIRTAIIYAMLEEHKKKAGVDYLNDVYLKNIFYGKPAIPSDTNSGFEKRNGMDEGLLKLILEDFNLTEKGEMGNPISLSRDEPDNGSITNLMRAILVSDSTSISNLQDEEIKIVMLDNPVEEDGEIYRDIKKPINLSPDRGLKQCFEMDKGMTVSFKVTIDHEILRSFSPCTKEHNFPIIFHNLYQLQKVIESFFLKVWEVEKNFFWYDLCVYENSPEDKLMGAVLNFYNKDDFEILPIINIGLGSGLLCKTLFVAMKEEYRIKIRNLQMTDNQIKNHNNGYVFDFKRNQVPVDWLKKLAPNSRHLVFRQNDRYSNAYRPLGWANLQFGSVTYEDNVL